MGIDATRLVGNTDKLSGYLESKIKFLNLNNYDYNYS